MASNKREEKKARKRARQREQVAANKIARADPHAVDWRELTPVWRLGMLDRDHPEWGWDTLTREKAEKVCEHLAAFESTTWAEILAMRAGKGPRNGLIPLEDLEAKNKSAVDRLRERQLDTAGAVMKLRINKKERLYGVMEGQIFCLVWYDENHGVWPRED